MLLPERISDVRERARAVHDELRRFLRTFQDEPADPLRILDPVLAAEQLYGYQVREVPFIPKHLLHGGPEAAPGVLDHEHKQILVVTATFTLGARRFTAAHELGHLVLHSGARRRFRNPHQTTGLAIPALSSVEEREAQIFASEFLMPAPILRRWFERHFGCERFDGTWSLAELARRIRLAIDTEITVSDLHGITTRQLAAMVARSLPFDRQAKPQSLAHVFQVSVEAMAIQLEDVGLVTLPAAPGSRPRRQSRRRAEVFMCYNSADAVIVGQIAKKLKARGIHAWLDSLEVRPGSDWSEEVQELLDQVETIAAFIGRDGIGPWQNVELRASIREFTRRGCRVIPVFLPRLRDDPDLPLFLRGFQRVDFRLLDPDPLERLIWGITGQR